MMGPPGHGGSGGRWRQARCRGGSPGVKTPSATGGKRRQSHLVFGLLRLRKRPPLLAWGMAWCGGGQEKAAQERGWVRVREGPYGTRDGGHICGAQGKGRYSGRAIVLRRARARFRARARARLARGRVRAHPRASLGLRWPCPMASGAAAAPGSTHAKGS